MASIAARRRVVSHLKFARRQTFTPESCHTSSSFPVSSSFGSSTASSTFSSWRTSSLTRTTAFASDFNRHQLMNFQQPVLSNLYCEKMPRCRYFSSTSSDGDEKAATPEEGHTEEEKAEEAAADGGVEGVDAEEGAEASPTSALEKELATAKQSARDSKDQMLRALADAENARAIARRDVENARNFAVTKFAKSLLDVADNLSLAIDSIPAKEIEENASLKSLMEGVDMTDKLLVKAFKEHGLVKYGARGDKFDPNLHDALFQLEDAELKEGDIGQVLKVGYQLKDRVIRPAQVGTVRK